MKNNKAREIIVDIGFKMKMDIDKDVFEKTTKTQLDAQLLDKINSVNNLLGNKKQA